MKKIFFLTMILLLTACAGQQKFDLNSYRSSIKPLNVKMPSYDSWQMENGLKVNHYFNPELPLVSAVLYTKGGSYHATEQDRYKVVALGGLMRSGGAGDLSAEQLDQELDELSAEVGGNIGGENGVFSFSSLKSDTNTVFRIFADVVLRPRFQQSRIDLWKSQNYESVARRRDDPNTIASIAFQQLIYQGSRFADILDTKKINALQIEDLQRLHQTFIRPEKATLFIYGDISSAEAKSLADKYLTDWKGDYSLADQIEQPEITSSPGIYFIEKDVAQSTIIFGHQGVIKLGPDHYRIDIFNDVFGSGGFNSELTKEVRVKKGLAYVTYGAIGSDSIPGRTFIYMQTKSESTSEALLAAASALNSVRESNLPADRIEEVKKNIENSFVFNFDSPEEAISRKIALQYSGLPDSYYDDYLGNISGISATDIRSVANNYFNPEKFIVLVVGSANAYNQLRDLTDTPGSSFSGLQLKKIKFSEKIVK